MRLEVNILIIFICFSRLNVNQSENLPKNIISSNALVTTDTTVLNKTVTKESHNATLTSYFHLRRSVRKTKKEVQEEKIKSIEQAVIEGREDGLEVSYVSCFVVHT